MRQFNLAFLWVVVLFGAAVTGCGEVDMALPGGEDPYYKGPAPSADAGAAPLPMSDSSMAADAGVSAPPVAPEDYGKWVENDFIDTTKEPLSTFSIDVDTASYTQMRQQINQNQLPAPDTVRVEEFINYFNYAYPQPQGTPFSINMEAAPSEFGQGYDLLRVGLQGLTLPESERKPANLIFLVDVSGSMSAANKLPLVQNALNYLLEHLEPTDTLGIVTYGTTVSEVLQPQAVTSANKNQVVNVINGLYASGSTAGGPGMQTAYDMAKKAMITGGINRVIMCTDGDFNVGLSGQALIDYIIARRNEGITLSVLGFGMGNYQDSFLEELSNHGNGNYAYIDTAKEAQRVFGEDLMGTLQVIAKDVKVQVEFNPLAVTKYRLVGYENRLLKPEDFKDDTKDAGEIGSGHTVTAFYEMELNGNPAPDEVLATVRFRYKEPDGDVSKELTRVIRAKELGASFLEASADFRFAAAVMEYAEILRKSKHSTGQRFDDVIAIATATTQDLEDRKELVGLVTKAKGLWPTAP